MGSPGRLRAVILPALGVGFFAVALLAIHHVLRAYRVHDITAAMASIPRPALVRAVALTAASYLVLTLYDLLACLIAEHRLPYRRIALASFVGYVFSHNVGLSFLGGAAIRYRLYGAWGLSLGEIGAILFANAVTFWLGFLVLIGATLLGDASALAAPLGLGVVATRVLGAAAVLPVIGYLVVSAVRRTPLGFRQYEVTLPPLRLALAQVALSVVDWLLAAAVLHALLPAGGPYAFPVVLEAFLLAQLAGLVTHVPAGLGVFEATFLLLIGDEGTHAKLLGALVAYRVIYYLAPLGVAAGLMGGYELLARRSDVARVGRVVGRWVPRILPQVFALATFTAGALLVLSGATVPIHGRLHWLADLVPLPVLEVSHFVASVAGIGLVLLARGLQQRLDAAWGLSIALLVTAALASVFRGLHVEEALALLGVAAALVPCRSQFYRRAALLDQRLTAGWMVSVGLLVVGATWLLILSYRHVPYAHHLWWEFELAAHAPRSMRAAVGIMIVLLTYSGARLLRPSLAEPAPASPGDVEDAATVVARSRESSAHLALLGDKTFLFNATRTAFVMYAVEGRSWVSMGDPIGHADEVRELAWRFREASDRVGGWTVFYEVGTEHLPLYLDLGLGLMKLGEAGRVELAGFGLEGGERKTLRQGRARLEREGCHLEIVEPAAVPALLPELRLVSDAWLASKNTREKRFSLGAFAPAYLERLPLAVVRQHGRLVAFANLWMGADHEELSPDLMRYAADAPPGIMDFLFIELMLWAKEQGYRWFELGMAPFSGLEPRALAPLWSRLGAFLFRHGEHFYNFQGLRQYKEKFNPVWTPRYLASPGGLALPRVLTNVATIVSGGVAGVVAR